MSGTEYKTDDFSQDPAGESSFNDESILTAEQQSNGGQKSSTDKKINASKHIDDGTKIFVGGLSWETNDKSMKEHFSQFGTVTEVEIKRDSETGRSRGFGFVLFEEATAVKAVLEKNNQIIDGKVIDAKIARALKKSEPVVENKKIFIGGLAPGTTVERITEFFGSYGEVEEVVLPDDKATRRKRGFGFVTFKEQEGVDKVLSEGSTAGGKTFVSLDGQNVEVKQAVPRDQQDNMKAQRGGRGGGRGGRGGGVGFHGSYHGDYSSGYAGGYGTGGYNSGYDPNSYNYESYDNSYQNYNYDQSQYGGQGTYASFYDGYSNQGYNQGGYNQGGGGGGGGYGKWNQGNSGGGVNRSGRGAGAYHPYSR